MLMTTDLRWQIKNLKHEVAKRDREIQALKAINILLRHIVGKQAEKISELLPSKNATTTGNDTNTGNDAQRATGTDTNTANDWLRATARTPRAKPRTKHSAKKNSRLCPDALLQRPSTRRSHDQG
jgi:hypothetical protein